MVGSRNKGVAASTRKWLTVVGIGEDGVGGLGEAARRAIGDAAHVFGGRRHLALAGRLIEGESHPWPSPFDTSMAAVVALRGENVCVLASGDPYFHGVGTTLSRVVDRDEIRVLPAPSAFSLAAARLCWPLQDCLTLSLHAAQIETLRRHLQPGRRILALTSGAKCPSEIALYLTRLGFDASRVTVLEALGGPEERVSKHVAGSFAMREVNALNLVAIEVRAGSDRARSMPCSAGLPDDWFDHDGQMTKREIRALTVAALQPRPGQRLWDIGGGAGSIAIEWMLADPTMQAIAIEGNPARVARIRANAVELGVPTLDVVEGYAPDALGGLPAPDAIFVGGGGADAGVMDAAITALVPEGKLVANAVTLEMERGLGELSRRLGGSLTKVALSRAEPLGMKTCWRPALAVTQWSWTKQ